MDTTRTVADDDAVDDVHVVLLGKSVLALAGIIQHCGPAVVECAVGLTAGLDNVGAQCGGDAGNREKV